MRKQLAQRIADPIVAELQNTADRVALIGDMADEDVEQVGDIEIAVLSDAEPDYFGDLIEPKVEQSIRILLRESLAEIDPEDEEAPFRRFIERRYGMHVNIYTFSDLDEFADATSWE